MSGLFGSPAEVARGLLTYTDWWQPATSSVIQVGPARRRMATTDGLPSGLLDHLDEREELRRRMQHVTAVDREVLFLWYVRQLAAGDIARELRISRRQCFRRRASAIRKIVELGEPNRAA